MYYEYCHCRHAFTEDVCLKTGIVSEDKELNFAEAARLYKEKIKVHLMLVGGIRSYGVAERVINEGLADYVS